MSNFRSSPYGRTSAGTVYGQANIVLPDDMHHAYEHDDPVPPQFRRKTKMICTMGPSCWDVDRLCEMIDEGMNVARLNFSHGDHEAHGATVARIHEALKRRPGEHVAILLDTKGPEIRSGFFREDVGKAIELVAGNELILTQESPLPAFRLLKRKAVVVLSEECSKANTQG